MRILFATDGSEGGLSPAQFLSGLPHRRDVDVHIVTVLDSNDDTDGSSILAKAEAALAGFPGHITTATGRGSSTSQVVEVLLYNAQNADVDLIAVGASGQSAISKFFLGSVAESVARHSPYPVLVTRPLVSPLQELIVGVDGSDCARAAAKFAAQLPFTENCTLRLTSVLPQPIFGVEGDPLYPGTADYQALEASNRESRKKALHRAEELADTLRDDNPHYRIEVEPVVLGNPATELVKKADERRAGLIVVGSQGISGIERFLLGSVSERVLRYANCSVMVVK